MSRELQSAAGDDFPAVRTVSGKRSHGNVQGEAVGSGTRAATEGRGKPSICRPTRWLVCDNRHKWDHVGQRKGYVQVGSMTGSCCADD